MSFLNGSKTIKNNFNMEEFVYPGYMSLNIYIVLVQKYRIIFKKQWILFDL